MNHNQLREVQFESRGYELDLERRNKLLDEAFPVVLNAKGFDRKQLKDLNDVPELVDNESDFPKEGMSCGYEWGVWMWRVPVNHREAAKAAAHNPLLNLALTCDDHPF